MTLKNDMKYRKLFIHLFHGTRLIYVEGLVLLLQSSTACYQTVSLMDFCFCRNIGFTTLQHITKTSWHSKHFYFISNVFFVSFEEKI